MVVTTRHSQQVLADLLDGPFAHHGGIGALAKAVGATRQTVTYWRRGGRPNYGHRNRLLALASVMAKRGELEGYTVDEQNRLVLLEEGEKGDFYGQ